MYNDIGEGKKFQMRRIGSGVNLRDDRAKENVYSSKNRCIVGWADGQQFLFSEKEVACYFKYLDGTKVRPASIVSDRVSTVYYRPSMAVSFATAQ